MKPEDLKPGLKVRHYKGHEYTIIAIAHYESEYDEDHPEDSLCVIYGDGMKNWVRSLEYGPSAFCGEASPGVPRFTVISEEQP